MADTKEKTQLFARSLLLVSGNVLLSRAVSSQVPSALKGLTSVFGMGTGGSLSPLSPEFFGLASAHPQNCTSSLHILLLHLAALSCFPLASSQFPLDQVLDLLVSSSSKRYRSSTDDLSPCRLQGVLLPFGMGHFFSRWASRLDAFSVYPLRISLPCYAVGTTTVAPVMRPLRSSRTRSSSSHVSSAHDG